jgi:hypothetical protein
MSHEKGLLIPPEASSLGFYRVLLKLFGWTGFRWFPEFLQSNSHPHPLECYQTAPSRVN